MKKWNAVIIAIAKSKLNWRHPQVANNMKCFIRQTMGHASTIGSRCATNKNETPRTLYGGTLVTAT